MAAHQGQLGVRLTLGQRKILEKYVRECGGRETISKVVRRLIVEFCNEERHEPVHLTKVNHRRVSGFAAELGRTATEVVNECVVAIYALAERGQFPLIVEELKLRRRYNGRR